MISFKDLQLTKSLTTDEFIYRSNNIFDNKYNYSKVKYKNYSTKVKIICPIHGIFEQKAGYHLQGNSCPKCGLNRDYKKISMEEIKLRSSEVHDNFYNYSLIEGLTNGRKTKVKIICPIHGIFEQTVDVHLSGHGCQICGNLNKTYSLLNFYKKHSIKAQEEGHLYQICIFNDNEVFFKIGITSKTIHARFNDLPEAYKYIILEDNIMSNLESAIKEREIHDNNKRLSCIPSIKFGGWTECYNEKIRSKI